MKWQIKKNRLLALACMPFFSLYALNLDQFFGSAFDVPPYFVWIATLAAVMPVLMAVAEYNHFVRLPILYWLLLYNIACTLGLTYSPTADIRYDAFVMLLTTNFILLPSLLISSRQWQVPNKLAILVLLLAISSVILDYFWPFVLAGLNPNGFLDRASGVYINPNIAGAFIPIMLAIALRESKPLMRLPLIIMAGLGVLLTFSRGGFIQFIYILLFLAYARILPRRYIAYMVALSVLFLFAGTTSEAIIEVLDIQSKNALARIDLFFGQGDAASIVDDGRVIVFFESLKAVFEAPYIGHGLGFNIYWGETNSVSQSSHNMFLRFMLDFGFIGGVIWFLFIFAFWYQLRKNNTYAIATALSGYVILVSIFSHNLTEQGWFLVTLTMTSMLGWSPLELKRDASS